MLALSKPDSNKIPDPMDYVNTRVYLVCIVILLVVGAFGNILLLATILMFKKLRSVNNILIFNLVLADSFSLVLSNAFGILGLLKEGEGLLTYGSRFCRVISYCYLSAMLCSVWSLVACALHIFIKVCHKGVIYKSIYTVHSVTVMVFWIWTLCPMIVLPSMMGWGSHAYHVGLMYCTYDYQASRSFTFFVLSLGYWLPFLAVAYCLFRTLIGIRAKKIQVGLRPEVICQDEEAVTLSPALLTPPPLREPLRAATLNDTQIFSAITAVSISIFIGWATTNLIWFLDTGKEQGFTEYGMLVARTSSSVNSIVYAVMNKDIRMAYISIIKTCRRCEREEIPTEVVQLQQVQRQPSIRVSDDDNNSGVLTESDDTLTF